LQELWIVSDDGFFFLDLIIDHFAVWPCQNHVIGVSVRLNNFNVMIVRILERDRGFDFNIFINISVVQWFEAKLVFYDKSCDRCHEDISSIEGYVYAALHKV
jgi:hypothetical protein